MSSGTTIILPASDFVRIGRGKRKPGERRERTKTGDTYSRVPNSARYRSAPMQRRVRMLVAFSPVCPVESFFFTRAPGITRAEASCGSVWPTMLLPPRFSQGPSAQSVPFLHVLELPSIAQNFVTNDRFRWGNDGQILPFSVCLISEIRGSEWPILTNWI